MNKVFTKENLLKIFKNNLDVKIKSDPVFGDILIMDPRLAYRFVLMTNSTYLVDELGISLFGLFKTYNNRHQTLNSGLFKMDNKNENIETTYPKYLNKYFPNIFKNPKKIIFLKSDKTSEIISNTYNSIISNKLDPKDYILNLLAFRKGSRWEHYFEFIVSEFFIKKSYYTDIQLPWYYKGGTPDFGVYYHHSINLLKNKGYSINGLSILELSSLRLFEKFEKNESVKIDKRYDYNFYVGEVKTSQNNSQINKYLNRGIANRAYEFIPYKSQKSLPAGLISLSNENYLKIDNGYHNSHLIKNEFKKDMEWFEKYLKTHLLANLSNKLLIELINKRTVFNKLNLESINSLASKLTIKEVLNYI